MPCPTFHQPVRCGERVARTATTPTPLFWLRPRRVSLVSRKRRVLHRMHIGDRVRLVLSRSASCRDQKAAAESSLRMWSNVDLRCRVQMGNVRHSHVGRPYPSPAQSRTKRPCPDDARRREHLSDQRSRSIAGSRWLTDAKDRTDELWVIYLYINHTTSAHRVEQGMCTRAATNN